MNQAPAIPLSAKRVREANRRQRVAAKPTIFCNRDELFERWLEVRRQKFIKRRQERRSNRVTYLRQRYQDAEDKVFQKISESLSRLKQRAPQESR